MDVLNRRIRGERNFGGEQMAGGTNTRRAKKQAARLCFPPGEQLGHGLCRAVHGHDEQSRKPKRQANRSKAFHWIVGSGRHGGDRGKLRADHRQQRVSVRGCTLNGSSGDRAAGDWTIFDDDVLVDIFRHDRRVLPRGDVGDAAGRNTDQDGDLPVWIVLPPGGTAHSQGDCEAAADQGMPNHGSLSANETLVGNCGSAWTCKELALSPPRCLAPQSTGLAPEALITLAQSGASDSMAAANCAGEVPIGTMPSSSKRLRTSG